MAPMVWSAGLAESKQKRGRERERMAWGKRERERDGERKIERDGEIPTTKYRSIDAERQRCFEATELHLADNHML